MIFVSLTRLRLRSMRFLPVFAIDAWRSLQQVRRASGFVDGGLLPDRRLTFWTLTAWDSQASMRQYLLSGAHKAAMPKLMQWCDEASVAHWSQEAATLPSWEEASDRMRADGRPSKVLHPSPTHQTLGYAEPRLTAAGKIVPVRK